MNVITFSGNLGRDVTTNNVGGSAVANFAVGMKSGWGDKAQTVWLDCALWGKQAESGLIQYLTKGQGVIISGELGTKEYQANDGSMKTAVTCRVSSIDLTGGANQQKQPQQQPQRQAAPQRPVQQPSQEFDDNELIPF